MLGKQMLAEGFGQFRTITKYVCWKRGIELISTDGQSGIQNAYADGLPGVEMSQPRSKSKSRKGKTRKPKK